MMVCIAIAIHGWIVVQHNHAVDTKVTPIWNTMAAIPGHIKDEVVVLGCHRDGQWYDRSSFAIPHSST